MMKSPVQFGMRTQPAFSGKVIKKDQQPANLSENGPSQYKLEKYARQLLADVEQGQPVYVKGDPEFIPLMYKMAEVAYRDKKVPDFVEKITEPELRSLESEANQFDYEKKEAEARKRENYKEIDLNNGVDHYRKAGLTNWQADRVEASIADEVPESARKYLALNPEELLEDCLSLRKGQPLAVYGRREHLPEIKKIVKLAQENEAGPIKVNMEHNKQWDTTIPFYRYGSKEALEYISPTLEDTYKEMAGRKLARLYLEGDDPSQLSEMAEAEQNRQNEHSKMLAPIGSKYKTKLISESPWCIYYAPTPKSARAAGYPGIKEAAEDAPKINRVGKLGERHAELKEQSNLLNKLVSEGYKTFHFVSIGDEDPKTGKKKDGIQTDFKISVTDRSLFKSVGEETPDGQHYVANVPSEESFTAPDWRTAKGHVSATKPAPINGKIVEGVKMMFKDGRVVKATADTNEKVLQNYIDPEENSDKLGELALVADSPIAKLNRVFNSILLDENTTCHIAVGSAYEDTIEGYMDMSEKEKAKAREELGINDPGSSRHLDFMIGGPNVRVTAIKNDGKKDAEKKVVIENDKFQLG